MMRWSTARYTRALRRCPSLHRTSGGQRPEDAAELAADVFRIAWQRFEPGEASRAWLFGIARNVVLEHYRKTGRRMAATRRYEAEFAVALALSMQLGGVTQRAAT